MKWISVVFCAAKCWVSREVVIFWSFYTTTLPRTLITEQKARKQCWRLRNYWYKRRRIPVSPFAKADVDLWRKGRLQSASETFQVFPQTSRPSSAKQVVLVTASKTQSIHSVTLYRCWGLGTFPHVLKFTGHSLQFYPPSRVGTDFHSTITSVILHESTAHK